MTLWNFGELMYYKHSKYMSSHEIYSMSLLGHLCIHDIPNLREFMYYIHYKYMPSHRQCKLVEYQYTYAFHPILENICILICLAWNPFSNHATNHHAMYALVLISCFFACKATTRGFVFYARSYNFLDFHMLCLQGSNPRTCSAFMILLC
jgi:hypothetical protein